MITSQIDFVRFKISWSEQLQVIDSIAFLVVDMLQSQHVPILDMYSLILVEATNDMSFLLPETKYDKPFLVIGNISIVFLNTLRFCMYLFYVFCSLLVT